MGAAGLPLSCVLRSSKEVFLLPCTSSSPHCNSYALAVSSTYDTHGTSAILKATLIAPCPMVRTCSRTAPTAGGFPMTALTAASTGRGG